MTAAHPALNPALSTPTPRFTLLAICDDVTTCDCCGKADLKCTMALQEYDADGNAVAEVYYGRDCGARALGWRVSADRAERFVRGTARVSWDACWRAVQDQVASGRRGRTLEPAVLTVDGVALQAWDTFYGALPEGKAWTRFGATRMYWRVA